MNRRIVIMGVPRSGKSTLAARLGGEHGVVLRSTDDLIGLEWSKVSEIVAFEWFATVGDAVTEGVRAVHGVRKWLDKHPEGLPADIFVWCDVPHVALTPGQSRMAIGCRTIWTRDVLPELRKRGAKVFTDTLGELAA